jgi:hypothetical protein
METNNPLEKTKTYYQIITGAAYLAIAGYIFFNPPAMLQGEENNTWRVVLLSFLVGYGVFRLARGIASLKKNKI